MMNKILQQLALALIVAFGMTSSSSAQIVTFTTAPEAQRHCPNDVIVWLNTRTGIFHMPGTRWYGATKSGAFVCEREADKAGDRQSRNGQ